MEETDILSEIKRKKRKKSPTWLSYAEEDWLIEQCEKYILLIKYQQNLIDIARNYPNDAMPAEVFMLQPLPISEEDMKWAQGIISEVK